MNPQEQWMWWRSSIFQDWSMIKLLHFCCHQFYILKEVPKPQRTIMSKTDWPNLVNPNSQSQQLELHTSHFLTTKLESWCDQQYLLWVLLNHSMGSRLCGDLLVWHTSNFDAETSLKIQKAPERKMGSRWSWQDFWFWRFSSISSSIYQILYKVNESCFLFMWSVRHANLAVW